jgi:hypothetical protein
MVVSTTVSRLVFLENSKRMESSPKIDVGDTGHDAVVYRIWSEFFYENQAKEPHYVTSIGVDRGMQRPSVLNCETTTHAFFGSSASNFRDGFESYHVFCSWEWSSWSEPAEIHM